MSERLAEQQIISVDDRHLELGELRRIDDHLAMLNDTCGNRIQVTQLLCR